MSDAYGRISSNIRRLGDALVLLRQQQQDPNAVAPHLVQAYKAMLQQQDALFAQQNDALYNAQRQDYLRLEAASTQFANEIRVASEYALLTAEERAREQGKAMLGNLNELAEHNALSFSRLEQWARFEERQRLDLAEEQGRQKQEQEQTKKEMQALKKTGGEMQDKMKEYEEKSRKFWRVIKEKEGENRRVQARALRLAAAAKELKGKGKASGKEVKELRKLAKATAKSARAASQHADDLGSASPPAETAAAASRSRNASGLDPACRLATPAAARAAAATAATTAEAPENAASQQRPRRFRRLQFFLFLFRFCA